MNESDDTHRERELKSTTDFNPDINNTSKYTKNKKRSDITD